MSERLRAELRVILDETDHQMPPQVADRLWVLVESESDPRDSEVAAWEQAHDVFCPRGRGCSTHLKPGHRHLLAPFRELCAGRDPAYPGQACPFPKGHGGPCFDNDDPTVDA